MSSLVCIATVCAALTVVDGDTLKAGDDRIRIMGIDSPERSEAGYGAARGALARLVEGQRIVCEALCLDPYQRTVAQCWLPSGEDLACAMVGTGHAVDWPNYSQGKYADC